MAWSGPRLTFGQAKAASDPVGLTCRQLARRHTMLAEAGQVVKDLPAEGEAIHGLMTGRYDLMHAVTQIIEKRATELKTPCRIRIATLSYNRRNLAEILRLLDGGQVGSLSLICSKFFKDNTKELYAETVAEFFNRPGRTSIAAPRSHCKVVCFDWKSANLVLEGSANLRTNGNWEQLTIINDRRLHDWHAAWIDGLIEKHATDQSGN